MGRGWRRRALGVAAWALALLLGLVWSSGADVWADGPRRLTTPVENIQLPADRPVRVAVIGDIQNGLSECSDLLALTRTLKPDLILQLGDIVNHASPGRYAALHGVFREHGFEVPVLSVPGNHDLNRSNQLGHYETWIGPTQWRIDLHGWRILGLNNAAGPLTPPSLEILKASGAHPPDRGLVVVAHRPLEASLEPRPSIVLSGHVHSSRDFVDEHGTRHFHHGNNCDRSHDNTPNEPPSVGILTLGRNSFDWSVRSIPRRVKLREEFRRLAGGSVYPVIRAAPAAFIAAILLLIVAGTWPPTALAAEHEGRRARSDDQANAYQSSERHSCACA